MAGMRKKASCNPACKDIDLERYEAKYILHPSQVPAVRNFIKPFVCDDPNASGSPPEYIVTTLQLDTDDRVLYRAKEVDALNRFKLRIRTYGTDNHNPVILEVKRKIKGTVIKTRSFIPPSYWDPPNLLEPSKRIPFSSKREEENYLNFLRLTKLLNAKPAMLVRYTRESYLGVFDNYARVTVDRNIRYRVAKSWEVCPQGGRWLRMDSQTALNRPFSGVVLELKTFNDAPLWMVELVQRFNLVRVGFSKYFTAGRLESLFDGCRYSAASENCSYY